MKRRNLVGAVLGMSGLVTALILSVPGVVAQDGGGTPQPDDGEDVTYTWAGEDDAPDFPAGADWINVSEPLTLADLRGKIVLLDFWTYGCINCIHIIPDLKRLETEYAEELVVVGVHSAKFDNEAETENIRQIVQRYEIEHPVINDSDFAVWRSYNVRAWPTVVVIDPFGKYVGYLSGEPLYERIQPVIETMAQEFGANGVLDRSPLVQWQPELASLDQDMALSFPGKVLADSDGNRLFIADSNHNRIVIAALDSYDVLDVIGSGEAGFEDGSYTAAQFSGPQGMTLVDNTLYVADTKNHALRAVDLDARTVATVAGTGEQGYNREDSGPGLQMALSSPWDVVASGGKVYIAMAGPHQIWVYDIASGEVGPYAGSGREALSDGALREAGMNQPSGIDTDGTVLYFADPEASAIRTADLDPNGQVKTIVGTGLFDFGDQDGAGSEVLLQHALGVTVADDGYLYVADTYNNKIKRIDPATRESVTYLGTGEEGFADGDTPQFYEPGGIDYADGKLYIADTNNHAIRVADLASGVVSTVRFPNEERLFAPATVGAQEPVSEAPATGGDTGGESEFGFNFGTGEGVITLPAQTVTAGEGTIQINVITPDGYKLNDDAPFSATWQDSPVAAVAAESRSVRMKKPPMPFEVPVTFSAGQGDVAVDLMVPWCEAINQTLCFVERVQLVVPLTVSADSGGDLVLMELRLEPPAIENTFE